MIPIMKRGTSITATYTLEPSASAQVCRSTSISGHGPVASIRAQNPSEHRDGLAPDFFTARRDFEAAWREFSAKKTEVDYQEWRGDRDLTARKYASWARGEKRPHTAP